MFNNTNKTLFMMTLMSGTLITISSSSWLSAWMGLEINLLSFIPLINNSNNLMSSETALKYFLTQAIASSIFFIAVIVSMMKNSIMNMNMNNVYLILISISLMIKTGIAPFHFWFPSIMEGLNWMNALILLVWQKIAPLMLIFYIFNMNVFIFTIIASAFIGALGGFNQTSLRKIMAFSSINHLAWMLTTMQESIKLFLIYFSFYIFLSTAVVLLFYYSKSFYMNQIYFTINNNKILKFILFINLMSLGGLPPFMGFLPKWIIIQQMMLINNSFIVLILIISSLITLFFYLRLSYSAFMIGNMMPNWNMLNCSSSKSINNLMYITLISLLGLTVISLFYI